MLEFSRLEDAMPALRENRSSKLVTISVTILLISGCVDSRPLESSSQESAGASALQVPDKAENSDHGYLTEDNRIPKLTSCAEWKNFWIGGGPAVSFGVADKNKNNEKVEVSTQIYLKNAHLDADYDGIICNENSSTPTATFFSAADTSDARMPVAKCMLKGNGLGAGFPRPTGYLAAHTDINAIMLFVEFPKIRITESIQLEARSYFKEFQQFMTVQSLGKQTWNFTVPDRVFKISRNPEDYGADFTESGFGSPNFNLYLQDAVSAADNLVDFSKFDVVYVIPPKKIGNIISFGPSFPRLPKGTVVSDEGSILAAATAGNDSRLGKNSEPWVWLAHETGHLYGLTHPLNEKGRYDKFGRELTASNRSELWDLMSWMRSPSPDFWGWSRFWIGWLGETETFCINPKKIQDGISLELKFVETQTTTGKVQLAILPLSAKRALVFESRKPSNPPFNGDGRLLVYKVDVTLGDKEGQIRIVKANDKRFEGFLDGSMGFNDKLIFDDIEISIPSESAQGLIVSIRRL